MSEQKTQVFYEIHVSFPRGDKPEETLTSVYGPYAELRHVKSAMKQKPRAMGRGEVLIKKVTRVYTDTVEEVKI